MYYGIYILYVCYAMCKIHILYALYKYCVICTYIVDVSHNTYVVFVLRHTLYMYTFMQ